MIFQKFEEAKENADHDKMELFVTFENLTKKKKLLEKSNEQLLEAMKYEEIEKEIVETDEYTNTLEIKLRQLRNFLILQ